MLLLQQIWTLQGGMQKNEKGQIATDQEKKNATRAANPTKRKIVGMEPNSANDPRSKRHITPKAKKRQPRPTDNSQFCHRTKKLMTPRLRFGETVDAGAYSTEDPPTT